MSQGQGPRVFPPVQGVDKVMNVPVIPGSRVIDEVAYSTVEGLIGEMILRLQRLEKGLREVHEVMRTADKERSKASQLRAESAERCFMQVWVIEDTVASPQSRRVAVIVRTGETMTCSSVDGTLKGLHDGSGGELVSGDSKEYDKWIGGNVFEKFEDEERKYRSVACD